MRRLAALALAVPVLAAGLIAADTGETPPEPIDYTFHLHGESAVDETSRTSLDDDYLPMDFTAPTASEPDSRFVTNYSRGPNRSCSGNNLFPTWSGILTGSLVDQIEVTIPAVGTTGEVAIDVFADALGGCNEEYVAPVASATATIPQGAGSITVTIPLDEPIHVEYQLAVMVSVPTYLVEVHGPQPQRFVDPTYQARLLYDSVDYQATVAVTCQPDDVPGETGETCEF